MDTVMVGVCPAVMGPAKSSFEAMVKKQSAGSTTPEVNVTFFIGCNLSVTNTMMMMMMGAFGPGPKLAVPAGPHYAARLRESN